MNDLSSRIRNVFLPRRLFTSFQRHVRLETDRNVEVMGIEFGKDYNGGKKVNRTIKKKNHKCKFMSFLLLFTMLAGKVLRFVNF